MKLNAKQIRGLQRYVDADSVKYPYEVGVRASTARALCNRGLLKEVFDHNLWYSIYDWSKYIVTDAGRIALVGLSERARKEP